MNTAVRTMNDIELLKSTRELAQHEREITTQVLRRLAEIERRKLYCDVRRPDGLKFGSLFDYAVHELKYSEGAADRRIQAMRLLKEIPELEAKIESGALSLTNVSRAQKYFREVKKATPTRTISREEKSAVLQKLEEKSSREGERILFAMQPPDMLPRERVRRVSADHMEVTFLMDAQLQAKLQEVRSLLGPRGASLGFAELLLELANLGAEKLAEQKFGKRRVQTERARHSGAGVASGDMLPHAAQSSRYIPRAVKHAVWHAAGGRCVGCGAQHQLQFDHVQPAALGSASTPDNLQLVCSSCNLRRGVKTFGATAMKRP